MSDRQELGEAERLTALANGRTSELERLAAEGATDADLADYFDVPVAALVQFDAVLRKARAVHRGRIRRAFLKAAEGSPGGSTGDAKPFALAYLATTYLRDDAQ